MIAYGRQSINEDDIQAVIDVLKSDYLTQGPAVTHLEKSLEKYFKVNNAIAVSSATAGLHCACLALGLSSNDYLWTTAVSFVASANCGKYCGANVKFIDVDTSTRNISLEDLEQKLKISKINGDLPKVLVVVHFAGLPCDMKAIAQLAQEYNFYVIEDAAHAIGSQYDGSPIGSCRYSDVTVFSFHPVKTIAAGEGGAILVKDNLLAKRARQYSCHGVEREESHFKNNQTSPCYYEMQLLGFNYRLSDIHAALALSQLDRLSQFVERRQYLVDVYNRLLKKFPLKLPIKKSEHNNIAWHIYVVECADQSTRNQLYTFLKKHNIYTNIHYIPLYRHPIYEDGTCSNIDYSIIYPNAEAYYANALTLPLYFDLSDADQHKIIALIGQYFESNITSTYECSDE